MDLVEANSNFSRATRHCDNLIEIHRAHGGPWHGRRDREVSINRAVVVLAIAAWQAVVQDYTLACLDLSAPSAGSPWSAEFAVVDGRTRTDIERFATPNAQNVQRLLKGAGFDPWPYWVWTQHGGRGQGMKTWSPQEASRRIDEWLKVRHAIAHGHGELPQVSALQAVRLQASNPPAAPPLRLDDAERCLAFFRRLARLTALGLASHLGVSAP
jgi:hypothetical protein